MKQQGQPFIHCCSLCLEVVLVVLKLSSLSCLLSLLSSKKVNSLYFLKSVDLLSYQVVFFINKVLFFHFFCQYFLFLL